ncbi:MAG: NepR family anti-sigma factor [Pseudomonadota bacterium]|nr:NepR family anti-sigma factor [Pseudomonadota bacterium]MEE3072324.1 NepR family anti-sigma factor [Pseudomonadota bacterium]
MPDREKDPLGEQIDANLRRVYQSMAEEPVPDRFMQLLKQLREQEKSTEKGGADK